MDNSTLTWRGVLTGLVLFTAPGCYSASNVDGDPTETDAHTAGTGGTLGQLATVGTTGAAVSAGSGVGQGEGAASGGESVGIPGDGTKTNGGDDDWGDDSSASDASTGVWDVSGGESSTSDDLDDGDGDGSVGADSVEETGWDTPECDRQWPDCTMWHKPSRDFWYGYGCISEQILLPTNKASMVPGQLVCETHPDSAQGDKRLIGAWRVLDTYEGNMWRRDGGGVCLEFEPAELPLHYPFHYELDGVGLTQFELDTLEECP